MSDSDDAKQPMFSLPKRHEIVKVDLALGRVLYSPEDGDAEYVPILDYCDEDGNDTEIMSHVMFVVAGPTEAGDFLAIDLGDPDEPILGVH